MSFITKSLNQLTLIIILNKDDKLDIRNNNIIKK